MTLTSLVALSVTMASGTTFFVAPNGNDSHTGQSKTQAFRTLNHAAAKMKPGDTCLVAPGTYRETVRPPKDGLSGKAITFRASGKSVILSGADPVSGFIPSGAGVFRAPAGARFTDLRQSDQVFEQDRMLELARWPKNSSDLAAPADAVVVEAKDAGTDRIALKVRPAFNEPDGRWAGAKVWVNLAHLGKNWGQDGQAQTGTVVSTDQSTGTIVVAGIDKRSWSGGKYDPDQPWGVGEGTEIHLFDPAPAGVNQTGGAAKLLAPGEWWINPSDATLFVRPRSGKPEGIGQKRRSFAFDLSARRHIVVDGFQLFGTSITTDLGADDRVNTLAPSEAITLRNLHGRYLTHFTDHTRNMQMMWLQRSGIRLSGTGHLLENCVFEDIAGPAVSVIGKRNRVMGNTIRRANYSASEAGCIDCGRSYDPAPTLSLNHEIGYNTIVDSPQQGLNIRGLINENPLTPGGARVHHNLIQRVMQRSYDSAAIDQFGTDGRGVRIDHNLISDLVGSLRIGIYTDFGFGYVIDHNVIWNVDRPIQVNHRDEKQAGNIRVEYNTALSAKQQYQMAGILNGAGEWNPASTLLNNIVSVRAQLGKGAKVEGNVVAEDGLFVNAAEFDFRPTREVNAGAYKFGQPRWAAGAKAYPVAQPK